MSTGGRRDFDVVIVGGGVIGTVMASLLVACRLIEPQRIAVISERFASAVPATADWDLRVFALSRASQRLLGGCGVWDSLPNDRKFAYERMLVWDAAGEPQGNGSLRFDCAELGEPNLGFIVDGRHLQWQSLQAARAAGAVLIEGSLAAISGGDSDIAVRLTDGRTLSSQLLIGADGQESRSRTLLAIDTAGHAYEQDALVAHVTTSKPHNNTAYQRFLTGGPLALLPLPQGRSSIVWSVPREQAERLCKLDDAGFGAAVTAASAEILGECSVSSARAAFPLRLQYALDYVRGRAVLIGDAAHAVHPLAGLGLNLGLLDCAALVDVMQGAGGAGKLGELRVLRRYERWRRSENLLAAGVLDGLERLFSSANPIVSAARSAGLAAVGRMPMIKRDLGLRALGLRGDVPQFLKADRAWPHK